MNQQRRREDVLEEQAQERQDAEAVAEIIRAIRIKDGWNEKLQNEELRAKYRAEAIQQGAEEAIVDRAFDLLSALAKCLPSANRSSCQTSSESFSQPVQVRIGGGDPISTTTDILTAEPGSMLAARFGPLWEQASDRTSIVELETASNDAASFTHILTYLRARRARDSELMKQIGTLPMEVCDLVSRDADYLGLAGMVMMLATAKKCDGLQIVQKQKEGWLTLHMHKNRHALLLAEKEKLERRLAALPAEIEQAAEAASAAETILSSGAVDWRLPVEEGDKVDVLERSEDFLLWTSCEVVEQDGAKVVRKTTTARRSSSLKVPLQLPRPNMLHPTALHLIERSCNRAFLDGALPPELAEALERGLDALLADYNYNTVDFHPGSGCQVVDLVHPSLHPYIEGVSELADGADMLECAAVQGGYAWLPARFRVDDEGYVSCESYINNLEQHSQGELYLHIASALRCALPLFSAVLEKDQALFGRTLQVVVKAAYYFIAPSAGYEGSWHLEGMEHEHIAASCLFYLHASERIRNNYLQFRYMQSDDDMMAYGAGGPGQTVRMMEELEPIPTPTGRALAWRNDVQHCVGPLTAEGDEVEVRKVLCLFLVDPRVKVVDSAMVPPQQHKISREEALRHRQALMNHRKYKADATSAVWEARTFTFCEH